MNLIKWILNKKIIEDDIGKQDRKSDLKKSEIGRIKKLQKENEFLIKRDNKLQLIETMFKNGSVDLKELNDLVLEVKNEER